MKKFCIFASGYSLCMLFICLFALICPKPFVPISHEESIPWLIFAILAFSINFIFGLGDNK